MLPPGLSDRRFYRPRLDRAWPHHVELIRIYYIKIRRDIGGVSQYGISLVRLRQANEPIKDVHDALISAGMLT
jgi:hypothetical protein